jgi:hypothetical protein
VHGGLTCVVIYDAAYNSNAVNHYSYMSYSLLYWLAPIVEFTIGIYLIARSRQLVEKLFKDEVE